MTTTDNPKFDPCPNCGGQGWTAEMEHGCDGDEERCAYTCPVQVQVGCGHCEGTGYLSKEEFLVNQHEEQQDAKYMSISERK